MDRQTQEDQYKESLEYAKDLTLDGPTPEELQVEDLGRRIRQIREQKGLSLKELADLTGFGEGLLESIETKKVTPALGILIKISKALHASFGQILSGEGEERWAITRAEDQKTLSRTPADKGKRTLYSYQSLAPKVAGRHMESLLVTLEGCVEDEPSIHDGEEFIYVLEGEVRVTLAGNPTILKPGDSVYYQSSVPHLLCSVSPTAKILAVLYGG